MSKHSNQFQMYADAVKNELEIAYQQGRADERERIIKELEEAKSIVPVNRVLDNIIKDKPKELGMLIAYDRAIKIVNSKE